MGEHIFVRVIGEVVGVNARVLADNPELAACDKNHDGIVKQYEAPDADTWERIKDIGNAYVDKPMPALQLAAPAIGIGVVGMVGRKVAQMARSGVPVQASAALKTTTKIGIIAATASLVKDTADCFAEDDVSVACFANATGTAAYTYVSAVASATAGTAAGTATTAATSPFITPVGGAVAGVAVGMTVGAAVQLTLDTIKRAVVFKLVKWLD